MLLVLLCLSLLLAIAIAAFYFRDRTPECFRRGQYLSSKGGFCTIQKIRYRLPATLRTKILDTVQKQGAGSRASIPGVRSGTTFKYDDVYRHVPELIHEYDRLRDRVSAAVGERVTTAPKGSPLSACIISYEREKDQINWHYDDNYFKGRFFTLLIPVSSEETCGNFQFRNHMGLPQTVAMDSDHAILFEGSHLLHRALPVCANQRRVIVSLQFCTDPNITNGLLKGIKELAF